MTLSLTIEDSRMKHAIPRLETQKDYNEDWNIVSCSTMNYGKPILEGYYGCRFIEEHEKPVIFEIKKTYWT